MAAGVQIDRDFFDAIRGVAPGTPLREALENILRARSGALIVLADEEQIRDLVDGGFRMEADFDPARLYELAKMDGAIVISRDGKKICYANVQLIPDTAIPSNETGIRHRTAERVARQTGTLVIAISQRRNVVTVYQGPFKYVLQDLGVVLAKANQALQTLERYRVVLEDSLTQLGVLEFEDLVTMADAATAIQRSELLLRTVDDIEVFVKELGAEGRLVSMQLDELVRDVADEELLLVRDYHRTPEEKSPQKFCRELRNDIPDLPELTEIARRMGYGHRHSDLEVPVKPRGYRVLKKIPRLPMTVIENLIQTFSTLQGVMEASLAELDEVEGIGEVRAQAIREGLLRLREQLMLGRKR